MPQQHEQGWLARVGNRERALATARAHLAAEVGTDVDAIMATVSRDPWFVLPERTDTGIELEVVEGTEDVHRYYTRRSEAYVVVASAQLASVAADWYVFNESAATLRQTGLIGGEGAEGNEFVVDSAILFPTAADGIRGEIALTRHPFPAVVAGRVPPRRAPTGPLAHLPTDQLANCRLLDDLLEALRTGAVADLLTPDHQLAFRVDGPMSRMRSVADHASSAAAALEGLVAGTEDLTLVTRLASEWYVFAEYLARTDEHRLRRLAAIHPVREGRLEGTFGYGIDVTA